MDLNYLKIIKYAKCISPCMKNPLIVSINYKYYSKTHAGVKQKICIVVYSGAQYASRRLPILF